MRQNRVRALQKARWREPLAAAGLLLLAGCAGGAGMWPEEPVPPAAAGPQPAYPGFRAPAGESDDQRGVLTLVEQKELETQLSRLAKEREAAVRRRIQRAK